MITDTEDFFLKLPKTDSKVSFEYLANLCNFLLVPLTFWKFTNAFA